MTTWIALGSITLPGSRQSVGEARQFAVDLLPEGERTETAELLISEACTNSVRHSRSRFGGTFTLRLFDAAGTLRCEVIDDGAPTVPTRGTGPALRDHGHGVLLIESLADRSGHFTDEAGRLHTWFELD